MRSKYGNRKIKRHGIVFDSKKEADRYDELYLLEKAGYISNLRMQVKYVLIPKQYSTYKFTKKGNPKVAEREVAYVADFVYTDNMFNLEIVEDVKGMKTKDYIIKRKLMLWVHGIEIREV